VRVRWFVRWVLLAGFVLSGSTTGTAACDIDPATLVRSTVSITRYFSESEKQAQPGVAGIRGTGWFLSPRLIVTAAHVAEAMQLSASEPKEIELGQMESTQPAVARILRIVGPAREKLAILDLERAIPDALVLRVRHEQLLAREPVVSIAYPKGHRRYARGSFVEYAADGILTGAALLEMADGNDRLVLDHGASGAPVLDCQGRVAAVVSTLITQTLKFGPRAVRTSTAWQTPNVISIPAAVLKDFAPPE
jgi:hypothetical protein